MTMFSLSRQTKGAVWPALVCLMSFGALTASVDAAAQQLYKSVGADGRVTYSDMPPPRAAKSVSTKIVGGSEVSTVSLPYELAQAVQANPVTLYTTAGCPACDSARKFLNSRGVPFAEKTVTTAEDSERLKQAGGTNSLPFVLIGRSKQVGFESTAWGTVLSAAGYPETSKLPRTYRNAAATAAAPVIEKETKANAKVEADPLPAVAPKAVNDRANKADKAPPGFHF